MVVKRIVREARKRVNEEETLSIAEIFKENRKQFWKGVIKVGKGGDHIAVSVRDSMGEELNR